MGQQEPGIFAAVRRGDAGALRELLQQEPAAVSARVRRSQQTPLMLAAETGEEECALVLLEAGADVSDHDVDGRTPLHHAVAEGRDIVASYLIAFGAKPTQAAKGNSNVVHWAVQLATENSLAVAKYVLSPDEHVMPEGREREAQCVSAAEVLDALSARNSDGATPLHLAAAEPDAEQFAVWMVSTAEQLQPPGGWMQQWLNAVSNFGTALHVACHESHADLAAALLAAGADARAVNDDGATPLHSAATGGDLALVDVLLNHDSCATYVGMQDGAGQTALHIVAATGRQQLLARLLSRDGAEVDLPDCKGKTPVQLASEGGHNECRALLAAAGADVTGLPEPARVAAPRDVQAGSEKAKASRKDSPAGGWPPVLFIGAFLALLLAIAAAWMLT